MDADVIGTQQVSPAPLSAGPISAGTTSAIASRAGSFVPRQPSPRHAAEALELAVERVLVAVRPSQHSHAATTMRDNAERSLLDAIDNVADTASNTLGQAVACAQAACEHLKYGELQEARLLLVAARGQLVRAHADAN